MKHRYGAFFSVTITFTLTAIFFSCGTTQSVSKNNSPAWASDVSAVYPQEQFIAQKGTGANQDVAQVNALAAISRYFEIEIESRVSSEQVITQQNDVEENYLRAEQSGVIKSVTNLFAVRQSENWFNKTQNQWETVAYIDRNEAWSIYEPQVRQKADTFRSLHQAAATNGEPMKQAFLYSSAQRLSGELLTLLEFAEILHPAQAAWFDDVRDALAEIPVKIEQVKSRSSIYIDCPVDFDATVSTALANSFGKQRFPIETVKGKAAYLCAASIGENIRVSDAGTFYYPTINVNITGKVGVLFSYSTTLNRIGASDPNVAKRRAYTAIANELQKSLYDELQVKIVE
jgi:hypothetical protein